MIMLLVTLILMLTPARWHVVLFLRSCSTLVAGKDLLRGQQPLAAKDSQFFDEVPDSPGPKLRLLCIACVVVVCDASLFGFYLWQLHTCVRNLS
jgi:hypothetical protein